MRIQIGKTTDDFHVYDNEGDEITEKLQIRTLSFVLGPHAHTEVRMTCYVDAIFLEDTMAEVTIIK